MISKQRRANYSSIDKFGCGCYIRKGKNEKMFFEVFPCNYHRSRINTVSWSLQKIEETIKNHERNRTTTTTT
jgi:hypothetical protein